jgi:hypothetical protein
MIHLPQICQNFLDFFHRLGDKDILWEKRNFGDCKRIFEQAVVEALSVTATHVFPSISKYFIVHPKAIKLYKNISI